MLRDVAQWWVEQMRSLIPGIAALASHQRDALIVAVDGLSDDSPSGTLLLREAGVETPLGPLQSPPETALATGLRLPLGAVLQRDVVLPLAAAHGLQTVLGFEMDRLTPFSADEVYWGIAGVQRDSAREKLTLRLSVVLRPQVDAFVQGLAGFNLMPSFIEVPGGRIELPNSHKRADQYRQWGLSGLCAVLALACLATPFIRQQMALDAAAQTIADNATTAHVAMGLRQQLTIAASGRAAIAQARRSGDALQVLATLTAALPDGTWLSDLTLKPGDVTFDGQSDNAAQLIGALSAVPGLHDPSFTAPVTRTADGKADQFSLDAKVAE